MATIEVKNTTDVNTTSNLSFNSYVTLKDSEQIIIDLEEKEFQHVQGKYISVKTGVIKKVRLEQLIYQSDWTDGITKLCSIEVRGFRKDGGLRYRSDRHYAVEQEVIDQIPDEYHNYAREAFAQEIVKLQQQLTTMTNEGVKIGNK
jgi:hypothetical protein